MLARLILFLILFYLVYFIVKTLILNPYRQGKQQGSARDRHEQGHQRERRQGDITITYRPSNKSQDQKQVGEYVDYEDLSDKDRS